MSRWPLPLLANLKLGNSLTLTGASCCAGVRSELSAGCCSGWLLLFERELVSGSSTAWNGWAESSALTSLDSAVGAGGSCGTLPESLDSAVGAGGSCGTLPESLDSAVGAGGSCGTLPELVLPSSANLGLADSIPSI